MRLFTAIDLPDPVLRRLERLINALRSEAHLKWSPPDNLHITLKFIGEWPENRLDELKSVLQQIPSFEPFDIEIRDLGWFPDERSPKVLWAGVHNETGLRELAASLDEQLATLGIAKEEREYSPHLTLARMKNPVPLAPLKKRIAELQPARLGSFPVTNYHLYRSDPGSTCSLYRKLATFPLQSAFAAS